MEKRIFKNQPVKLQFDTYGNYATLTPIKILKENHFGCAVVLMGYGEGDNRTIDLCFEREEVDFESFGEQYAG